MNVVCKQDRRRLEMFRDQINKTFSPFSLLNDLPKPGCDDGLYYNVVSNRQLAIRLLVLWVWRNWAKKLNNQLRHFL